MPLRESNYTTLMMATGLTFGSISALFGYNYGYINQDQYSVLVTVVIASAVIPTIIAQVFFSAPGNRLRGGAKVGYEGTAKHTSPSAEE